MFVFFVVFIYFQNLGCNHTTENTIQYMHTWILKDECVDTYIAPIKQKNVATCRTIFHPCDMSKQIEHVQFLSTCRTNEQQVAVEEAGVDGFVDMSNIHQ